MKLYDEDGNEVDPSTIADSNTQKILQKMEDSDDGSTVKLGKLLGDPAVQEILEARDRGEEVRVSVGEEKKDKDPVTPTDKDIDIEEMSNKDLKKHIADGMLDTIKTQITDAMKPLTSSLEELGNSRKAQQEQETLREWERMKQIDPELEEYKPKIIELHELNPNLSLEQLYVLASGKKLEKGKKLDLGTERPTPSKAPTKRERKVPLLPGVRGFRQLVSEGSEIGVAKAIEDHR